MTEGAQGVLDFLERVTTRIENQYAAALKTATKESEDAYNKRVKAKKKAMKEDGATDKEIEKQLEKMAAAHERHLKRMEKASERRAKAAKQSYKDEAGALTAQLNAIDAVKEKLAQQQDILADMKQQAIDYASGIRDAIVSAGDITKMSGELPPGPGLIIEGLQKQVDDAQEFSDLILSLTQQGLNTTAIQQLIDAGVEGGLATAQALAAGGPEAIAQINALQAQLQTIGQNLGNTTAQTMYAAGIQAQQGLVDGLQSDLAGMEAVATKLARILVRAIRKALKIQSPSKVFESLGKYTVAGMEVGIKKGTGGAVKATTNIADAMTKSWTQPTLQAGVVTGSGAGTQSIAITLTAQQLDQLSRGKQIQADLDAYKKAGGQALV